MAGFSISGEQLTRWFRVNPAPSAGNTSRLLSITANHRLVTGSVMSARSVRKRRMLSGLGKTRKNTHVGRHRGENLTRRPPPKSPVDGKRRTQKSLRHRGPLLRRLIPGAWCDGRARYAETQDRRGITLITATILVLLGYVLSTTCRSILITKMESFSVRPPSINILLLVAHRDSTD